MSLEQNQATLDRLAAIWNGADLAGVDDCIAADYVRHDPGLPMEVRGPEGVRQLIGAYRQAFPDLHFTGMVTVAEGDLVAVLWQAHGTQHGELMGIPPTGKAVAVNAADFYRFVGGKIVEQWTQADNLGLLQQLGVVPVPA